MLDTLKRWGARMVTGATLLAPSSLPAADGPNLLWYARPAANWVAASPVGNGRLGAMVFGQPRTDRLQLNEITVWSGDPNPDADLKDAYKSLPELRRLIRDGQYAEAEKFTAARFNGKAPYTPSYQTLGDLNFEYALPAADVAAYRRDLDIAQAVAAVSFTIDGVTHRRETFVSAPDQVLVQRLTADRLASVGFTLGLTRAERAVTRFEAPDTLVMTGNTGNTLTYEVRCRVIARGGKISGTPDGRLTVQNADEAVVLLTAATSFVLDYDRGYQGADLSVAARQLVAAAAKPYDALRADHIADYRRYFDRVHLDLGGAASTAPTDERLKSYKTDRDPAFAALFYQFGRYLLICSSRPDNLLPSNSQGLWGDGFDLPWKCDYKSNINYQMNYWAAEPSNLSEMHRPMLRMTQNLVKPGTKTARAYFGPQTPGWVVGYTTNGWSWTSPGQGLPWGVWFGGSAWMCQHLWEHYAFTRDADYLKSIYPTLRGAAEFWLANLVEGPDGALITSPSTSPENSFTTDSGVTATVTEGATMERSLVWELFDNTIQAARVLGLDTGLVGRLTVAQARIRPPQVGRAGQLMEWNGDWDLAAKDMHHRHISHLYGLHPGHQITALGTPALAAAAKQSLDLRGDDGTGWSLAWKINCRARLRDGDHAHDLITYQLRHTEQTKTIMADAGGTYPNLFDAHPPFQIDGNFGYVSGVNEMLVQSHERYVDPLTPGSDRYFVDLLPALPRAWTDGAVRGLRTRGGFELSMRWRAGQLLRAEVRNISAVDATGRFRFGGRVIGVSLRPGETRTLGIGEGSN